MRTGIVIIDPDNGSRAALGMLFASFEGWQVFGQTADGREGIRMARASNADALVVDSASDPSPEEIQRLLPEDSNLAVVALLRTAAQHARRSGPAVLKDSPPQRLRTVVEEAIAAKQLRSAV